MKRKIIVLLADDDANDRHLFKHALKCNGVEIELREVSDGEDFTEYLKAGGRFADRLANPLPDLIILDLKMPRMDGLQSVRSLRKQPEYQRTPVVMLSGSGLEKDVQTAYGLGVNTYFSKPANLQALMELIKLVIDYWSRAERPVQKVR